MRIFVVLFLGVVLVACPGFVDDDGSSEGEGEGEGEGNGGEGEGEDLQFCAVACVADDDCNPAGGATQRCDDGGCVYLGCRSDADCRPGFSCGASQFTAGLRDCFPACDVDGDCGDVYGTFGPSRCVDSQCRGVGCADDAECAARLGAAYTCEPQAVGPEACTLVCDVDADCVEGLTGFAFDLVCTDGRCSVEPCEVDADCPEAFGRDEVCR